MYKILYTNLGTAAVQNVNTNVMHNFYPRLTFDWFEILMYKLFILIRSLQVVGDFISMQINANK